MKKCKLCGFVTGDEKDMLEHYRKHNGCKSIFDRFRFKHIFETHYPSDNHSTYRSSGNFQPNNKYSSDSGGCGD